MSRNNALESTTPLTFNSKLVWKILSTSGFFILARAFGAVLPIFLAYLFGTSHAMDNFFMAFALQAFIVTALSSVAEISIVPYLLRSERGDAAATLRFLLIIGPTLALGLVLFLNIVVSVTFPSPTAQEFWKLSLFPAFSVGIALLTGGLNAQKHFVLTAVIPGLRPIFIIGLLLLSPLSSPQILAFYYTISEGILFFYLLLTANHKGILRGTGSHKGAFMSLKGAAIYSCGMVLLGLNPVIDRTFASWTGQGGVSIMEYAYSLFYIPALVLSGPLVTILLTRWSSINDLKTNTAEADRAALWVLFISLIIFVIFLLVGKPLLQFFLSYRITHKLIDLLWLCAVILLSSLAPYVAASLYSRVLLIEGKNIVLMIIATLNACLNIILNTLLYRPFGLVGIALSTAVTSLVITIILRILLRKLYAKTNPVKKRFLNKTT